MRRSPLPPPAALLCATLCATLFAAAGCASAAGSAAEPPRAPSSVRIVTAGGMATTVGGLSSDGSIRGTVSAPVETAWRALPGIYASIKIPLTVINDSAHFLGNEGLKIRRAIGGQPLMRYLDCGSGSGGPNAETFDIRLAIYTQLRPAGGTASTATTTIQASARNPSFNSAEMACMSNGLLEQRINDLLEEAVNR